MRTKNNKPLCDDDSCIICIIPFWRAKLNRLEIFAFHAFILNGELKIFIWTFLPYWIKIVLIINVNVKYTVITDPIPDLDTQMAEQGWKNILDVETIVKRIFFGAKQSAGYILQQ